MNMTRVGVASVFLLALAAAIAADEPPVKEPIVGFQTGNRMPVFVVDFVSGDHKGHCGCPAAMVSNARARGVILFAREADDSVLDLAKSLDAAAVDGKKLHGHLVALSSSEDALAARVQKAGIEKFHVGVPRTLAKNYLKDLGLADKAVVHVLLSDRKDVKAVWSFAAGELTAEKRAEITTAAEKFARGDGS